MSDDEKDPQEPAEGAGATERPEGARTSAEAAGSVIGRITHPVHQSGREQSGASGTASARTMEGELVGMGASPEAVAPGARPRRQVGRRDPQVDKDIAQHEAQMARPLPDEENTHWDLEQTAWGMEQGAYQEDPREDRFAEFQVSALFALGMAGTLIFCLSYFLVPPHTDYGQEMNIALGFGLALSLLGIGGGSILWAKKLIPHEKAVQDREQFHSDEEVELAAEQTFYSGLETLGVTKRPLLRRTLLGALALFPLPFVVALRDLGPLPHSRLRHTGWAAGKRMVDPDTKIPVKIGDIEIGGIKTVMPEGFTSTDEYALAPTILIRFAPGEIRSQKEESWGVQSHVAYSKICSHAGCPISLYEQQTHNLLCPCHQSTFDMANDANVVFGPAARRLPQLKITLDNDGYFIATGDYNQPVGPSFWERG